MQHIIDVSKIAEAFVGAFLAFLFAYFLGARLARRQERFQGQLLERQLTFMEKMEKDRAENEAKAEAERTKTLLRIVGRQNENDRSIARENRNHESRERTRDRMNSRDVGLWTLKP